MRYSNFRISPAVGSLLLGAMLAAGCTDTAARARNDSLAAELTAASSQRDSLQNLVQSTSADKDRALAQVV
ncbi:MAG TPA: hypothetical protein VE869_13460 [Gemmatimonas sp.]|nr:hypothetical protein [Gemmatimonas sp.]